MIADIAGEVAKSGWWYASRTTGIVSWFLFTASVMWGIFTASKYWQEAKRPKALLDLHRWFSSLAWGFVAFHLFGLWADSYVDFGVPQLFVPFASTWKSNAVAFGVVSFWLLAVVQLTSLARNRLSRSTWKRIHLTSYVAWWGSTMHGILAGTDASNIVFRSATMGAVSMVCVLGAYRLLTRRRPSDSAQRSMSAKWSTT